MHQQSSGWSLGKSLEGLVEGGYHQEGEVVLEEWGQEILGVTRQQAGVPVVPTWDLILTGLHTPTDTIYILWGHSL